MLSIGALAKEAGVKVPTIRYYEQIGLLEAPPRTEGQQRRYGAEAVRRLNFIRHSRELGFEIEDIRELLSLTAQPSGSCENADKIAARHLDAVDLRIRQLTLLRNELKRMLDECHGGCVAECRVIDSLSARPD
ncbi:helix-turn-helix domain-containing protein [Bradyrhizobium sp. 183]|uniref:MerR family transcriptional regulator n=1 Tax=unclassified Bradyrhizobium TaxID=2631580 RepID=UPI001FFE76CA|nr:MULTISPECIES: helix-turn-helix domain-containing protein [unclassified Bradyrhizobium]UPJ80755.1 helix-turn-helix domain-containing protein [Bradyrhizobium sp. 184]UPJ88548.1 helix-turn-helix domain-containing protein [Bradyrhizobium sp. 183]